MTTRNRVRRRSSRSTTRRKTEWQQLIFNTTLLPTGAIVAADLTLEPISTGGASHRGGTATLRRALMHFDMASVDSSVIHQFMSVGIYVADHEAIVQGAFNDPNSDPEQDWYYWTSRALRLNSNGVTEGIDWDVDIRSM